MILVYFVLSLLGWGDENVLQRGEMVYIPVENTIKRCRLWQFSRFFVECGFSVLSVSFYSYVKFFEVIILNLRNDKFY